MSICDELQDVNIKSLIFALGASGMFVARKTALSLV